MNIVLLTNIAGNGGSAATAYRTTRLLARAAHHAVLFAPGDYWARRGREENVPVRNTLELRRGFRPLSFWRDFRMLRKFLEEQRTDAVIVQKSPEQWLAFLVLRTIRRPLALVRMRGVVIPVKPGFFNRWLHRSMHLVLCSASVIAERYRALPGFDGGRVRVLLEGVNTERFAPPSQDERAAARRRFGLDPQALLLGTAGRPSPVKGHDLLLKAFAKVSPEETFRTANVRLCIFSDESRRGPGSYTDLEALCAEQGVAGRVDWRPGFIEDMRAVYHALDAYILPSRGSEGSSRAALEASSSGLPLIASRVGVLPDLVEDGKTGILVEAGEEEQLAAALRRLVEEWPRARALGEAARRHMRECFREEQYAGQLAARLEEALQKARANGAG